MVESPYRKKQGLLSKFCAPVLSPPVALREWVTVSQWWTDLKSGWAKWTPAQLERRPLTWSKTKAKKSVSQQMLGNLTEHMRKAPDPADQPAHQPENCTWDLGIPCLISGLSPPLRMNLGHWPGYMCSAQRCKGSVAERNLGLSS